MKVFIWDRIKKCTDSYHTEGGVVVFATDEQRAREVANSQDGCNILPEELPSLIATVTDDVEEQGFIMPDAGCC